jgi:hypothetical protein
MSSQPNRAEVEEFFEKALKDQIHLTVIDPERLEPTIGQDFGTDVQTAASWALARNSEHLNVHYSVNLVRTGLNKKPSKADFVGMRFAHLDVDPPKGNATFTPLERHSVEQQLLDAAPCTIVWSGNGYQALWRLNDSPSVMAVEEINKGLIEALNGDRGTHDVSRLLRVPGLVNWPDPRKRELGRVPALACIRYGDDGSVADLVQLQRRFPAPVEATRSTKCEDQPRDVEAGTVGDWQPLTAEDLGLPEATLLRRLIEAPEGKDRSRDTLHMTCEGLRYGLTKEQVVGVLLNPVNAISAHCLGEKDPLRAAQRSIERALGEEDVMALFRVHDRERDRRMASGEVEAAELALTAQTKLWTMETMLSDCVFIEDSSQVADTTRLGYVLGLADFRNSTAASVVTVERPAKNGSVRKVKALLANEWLAHPERATVSTRTFKAGEGSIVTAPDGRSALNSWRGFKMDQAPDDWAERARPFVEHVGLLFGSDQERFLDWTAHTAQRPGELPTTAWLHVSRKTGTGRNLIAKILGKVFIGYAALAFPLAATLRDGFNAGLAGKVLAVVDEIDEGNSHRKHQMAQDLKQLITAEVRTINQKFASKYEEKNACRWLIFSNSTAALPLEDEDRRFNVVQFDGEPEDAGYYKRLYTLADDPAFIASVMQYLLRRDISGFNAGDRAAMTAAKVELLNRTRSEDEQTLRAIAERWPVDIITSRELHTQLGESRITGPALGHALDRSGIVRVGEWKEVPSDGIGRQKVTAYAVRNHAHWKTATTVLLRREIDRATKEEKDAALYDTAHLA